MRTRENRLTHTRGERTPSPPSCSTPRSGRQLPSGCARRGPCGRGLSGPGVSSPGSGPEGTQARPGRQQAINVGTNNNNNNRSKSAGGNSGRWVYEGMQTRPGPQQVINVGADNNKRDDNNGSSQCRRWGGGLRGYRLRFQGCHQHRSGRERSLVAAATYWRKSRGHRKKPWRGAPGTTDTENVARLKTIDPKQDVV